MLQLTIVSYRVPSRKHDCYSVFVIIKRGQSCLFEASARQDDPKNGKKIWIEWTWRQLQSVHMTNQRSDFFATRLEVKWSLLTYWARRCKAIYMTLKEDFETEKSNHQVFTSRESKSKWPVCNSSRIPALSWNMVRNNQLNYRLKPVFTVYSRSLITISLNNRRINCYLSLFRCSINLKSTPFCMIHS